MAKYRAKPVVIDAWQVGTEPRPHWIDVAVANGDLHCFLSYLDGSYYSMEHYSVEEGLLWAYPSDWIIRGPDGELYPCKDSIFHTKYEVLANEEVE